MVHENLVLPQNDIITTQGGGFVLNLKMSTMLQGWLMWDINIVVHMQFSHRKDHHSQVVLDLAFSYFHLIQILYHCIWYF